MNNNVGEKVVSDIKKDFVAMGAHRVHGWYAWAIVGIVFGMAGGIIYVSSWSNQRVTFDASKAAGICPVLASLPIGNVEEFGSATFSASQKEYDAIIRLENGEVLSGEDAKLISDETFKAMQAATKTAQDQAILNCNIKVVQEQGRSINFCLSQEKKCTQANNLCKFDATIPPASQCSLYDGYVLDYSDGIITLTWSAIGSPNGAVCSCGESAGGVYGGGNGGPNTGTGGGGYPLTSSGDSCSFTNVTGLYLSLLNAYRHTPTDTSGNDLLNTVLGTACRNRVCSDPSASKRECVYHPGAAKVSDLCTCAPGVDCGGNINTNINAADQQNACKTTDNIEKSVE